MKIIFAKLGIFICIILAIISSVIFCYTHKTRYLNIETYRNAEYMEIIGTITLKDYPNTAIITDKEAIGKILNYLNGIPLVSVYAYFDRSRMEFIIPELTKDNSDYDKHGSLIFYNDGGIEEGRITLYNERYIEGINYHAYKTKDEKTLIISGLESLSLK